MEAHGGYLCRLENLEVAALTDVARRALAEEGAAPDDCSLLLSLLARPRVLRIAFDAPYTYGRKGARWYDEHRALAKLLSREQALTVHVYVFDPDELEKVVGYGGGRVVGGETMRYDEAELPEDDDEGSFERLKSRWPLGHLAKVLGVTREDLVRVARAETLLVELDEATPRKTIAQLFTERYGPLPPETSPRRVEGRLED